MCQRRYTHKEITCPACDFFPVIMEIDTVNNAWTATCPNPFCDMEPMHEEKEIDEYES